MTIVYLTYPQQYDRNISFHTPLNNLYLTYVVCFECVHGTIVLYVMHFRQGTVQKFSNTAVMILSQAYL